MNFKSNKTKSVLFDFKKEIKLKNNCLFVSAFCILSIINASLAKESFWILRLLHIKHLRKKGYTVFSISVFSVIVKILSM